MQDLGYTNRAVTVAQVAAAEDKIIHGATIVLREQLILEVVQAV
jgi:hypothetical protein